VDKIDRPDTEWKTLLTSAQYEVLREEGTERPHSSPLNQEKRKGTFVCAGCGQPLFKSETKYDSRTGWPSFYASIPGALETRVDRKLLVPRTEYHTVPAVAAIKATFSGMAPRRPDSASVTMGSRCVSSPTEARLDHTKREDFSAGRLWSDRRRIGLQCARLWRLLFPFTYCEEVLRTQRRAAERRYYSRHIMVGVAARH
jgi:methionine-R-sulfoxide reductase